MSTKLARKIPDAYHHGDLRAALVAAATAEIERGGPESVSLNALAKDLRVSQAAPYRHFATRDDLLEDVAATAFRRFNAEIGDALEGTPASAKIERAARAYVRIGTKHRGLYRLMYASHLVERTEVGSELQVAVEEGFQIWLSAFDPSLPLATRERIAVMLWVSLHGVVMLAEQGFLPLKVRRIRPKDLVDDIIRETEREVAAALSRPNQRV